MSFKSFDFLSPDITLHFLKTTSHSSVFSGLLTIFSYLLCFSAAIYFSLDFLMKTNPAFYFYNKYINDVGEYPMHSRSMFHFVQFISDSVTMADIDLRAVTIVGLNVELYEYFTDYEFKHYDHWTYDHCNKSIDAEGRLDMLEEFENFEGSVCIRQYYNATTQQLLANSDINNSKFVYPKLAKGNADADRVFYGVVIMRCRNDSFRAGLEPCYPEDEITEYMSHIPTLSINVVDNYVDVGDYKSPFKPVWYKVTNGMYNLTFTTNHFTLNPLAVNSHVGFIFDEVEEIHSYAFDQNEKITMETKDSRILCAFYFWISHRMQIYERKYMKIQDTVAGVTGIMKIITTAATLVNMLFHRYITLLDTSKLMDELTKVKYSPINQSFQEKEKKDTCYPLNNFIPPLRLVKRSPSLSMGTQKLESSNKNRITVSFFEYVAVLFNCGKKTLKKEGNKIFFLQELRERIISEEQMFKDNFMLYKMNKVLQKQCKCDFKVNMVDIEEMISFNKEDGHMQSLDARKTTI